jgi:predicted dithiol-disulfide oxidoreductase (DUF899 family)
MDSPRVVTQKDWLAARKQLLAKEKEFTHQREALAAARRQMPVVKLEKEYVFEGPRGVVSLRDLFESRRQLIIYHLMFEPTRTTACKHRSCVMDNIAGALIHLTARGTSFAAVSRAPIEKIEAFKKRMEWNFTWVSSFKNDFNYDYQVTLDPDKGYSAHNYRPFDFRGELPGLSVFIRANNEILHSYSAYLRGIDVFLPMYHLLDATPLGRQEDKSNSMAAGEASWVRYHDSYDSEARGGESHSAGGCHDKQEAR